jgi:hypothetical protein
MSSRAITSLPRSSIMTEVDLPHINQSNLRCGSTCVKSGGTCVNPRHRQQIRRDGMGTNDRKSCSSKVHWHTQLTIITAMAAINPGHQRRN